FDGNACNHEACWGIEANGSYRFLDFHYSGFNQHSCRSDGAVTAHRNEPCNLDVENTEITIITRWRHKDNSTHRTVSTWPSHQQLAQMIQILLEVKSIIIHGFTGNRLESPSDHASRHAFGMGIDC